jgi:hypothetical protein
MLTYLLPLTLASAAAPLAPADAADLRCVAAFAAIGGGGAELSVEQRSGIASLVMYYIGRLEGRGNGVDLERGLTALLEGDGLEKLMREDAPRCGSEAQAKGSVLTAVGKRLEAAGK